MWDPTHDGTCVEVKGQLAKVSLLLPLHGPCGLNSGRGGLGGRCLHPLSHPTEPKSSMLSLTKSSWTVALTTDMVSFSILQSIC